MLVTGNLASEPPCTYTTASRRMWGCAASGVTATARYLCMLLPQNLCICLLTIC